MVDSTIEPSEGRLRVEIRNSRPVDVADLATSLASLGAAFRDFANDAGDPLPDNIRLYVHELRTGSIIAELSALAEQAQWILEHLDVLAGFYTNLHEVIDFFSGRPPKDTASPTRQVAQHVSGIVDP